MSKIPNFIEKRSGKDANTNPIGQSTFAMFLQATPPGVRQMLVDGIREEKGQDCFLLRFPSIELYCVNDRCRGIRFFRLITDTPNISLVVPQSETLKLFQYQCANCSSSIKRFAVAFDPLRLPDGLHCLAAKLGELPAFGQHDTPTRLLTLLGDERDAFLKGRRCENQGLGIGAFSYYRRVVENKKNAIIDSIIKVATALQASSEALAELQAARDDTRFAQSLGAIKTAIPQVLLINGHNPLTLLHNALSEGLHSKTDEECLSIAHSVRVVLSELAERLSQALKDEKELNDAVARLMKPIA